MTTPFPFVASQVLTAAQLNDIQNLPISDKTASYTLVVADVYKRTIMNNASATTITVNNSIFTVGDVIQVANKGAGACTITAGAGVTINTSGSLALAQYGGGYLLALSASTFTFFNLGGGAVYGVATGGTSSSITVGGINYTLLTFTSDGTLTVTKAGAFDVLMFGGGAGGGGANATGSGGGGGAGGYAQGTFYFDTNQSIDVGAGSAGGVSTFATRGSMSSLTSSARSFCVAGGGGGNGGIGSSANQTELVGGCGGGGGGTSVDIYYFGGASVAPTVQGFAGAQGNTGNFTAGSGGGGVTAVGVAFSGANGGAGGAGYDVSAFISGSALFKGGGGGGGATTAGTGGAGGSSVGGAGGTTSTNGSAAAANTASGGGGVGYRTGNGGAGGSGIVYVRFKV